MDIKKTYTIYPIYLDSLRSHHDGRKYNLKYCVPNITYTEIASALKALSIPFLDNPQKRHPREPFIYGRVHVSKEFEKYFVLSGIKNVVEEAREERKVASMVEAKNKAKIEAGPNKKGFIKNDLNLVPRKKNKKKK